MPPSGFNKKELKNISLFSKSLLKRFNEEVKTGIHSSISSGIESELDIIEQNLVSAKHIEKGLLLFTKHLYLEFKKDFELEKIEKQIFLIEKKEYKRTLL